MRNTWLLVFERYLVTSTTRTGTDNLLGRSSVWTHRGPICFAIIASWYNWVISSRIIGWAFFTSFDGTLRCYSFHYRSCDCLMHLVPFFDRSVPLRCSGSSIRAASSGRGLVQWVTRKDWTIVFEWIAMGGAFFEYFFGVCSSLCLWKAKHSFKISHFAQKGLHAIYFKSVDMHIFEFRVLHDKLQCFLQVVY